MAKRFTDTDKWRIPFMRKLTPKMKLLWLYVWDDCDIAGVWQVDYDVAGLRIGEVVTEEEALEAFKDKIIEIDNREKWFIPSFLELQHGTQLSKSNNVFPTIDKVLTKYNLYQYLGMKIVEIGTTTSAIRGRLSQKVKDKILLDAEFICQYCQDQKTKHELVVDHFIPIDKGGDNSDENLVCSCVRCNGHKTNLLPDVFLSKPHIFLKPTEKINSLLGAFNKLKGANNTFEGGKVIVKVIEEVKVEEKVKEKGELTEFERTFLEFEKMRTRIKKPLTPYAKELILKELQKLSPDEQTQIQILNQSIRNSYQGVFPLKNDGFQKNTTSTPALSSFDQKQKACDEVMEYFKNELDATRS